MHFDVVVAENFGADDSILREVLGNPSADHQKASRSGLDLDVGQLTKVGDTVERHIVAAALHSVDLMLDETEARRTIGEGRAEDRDVMLEGKLDETAFLFGVALAQPSAHLADEGPAAEGAGLEAVSNRSDRMVAILKLLLIDIGIVDAVDVERAQRIIIRNFIGLVVFVTKRFEEIHVDDGCARCDNRVDHVRSHELGIEVHAAAGRSRSSNHQDDRAALVFEHHL